MPGRTKTAVHHARELVMKKQNAQRRQRKQQAPSGFNTADCPALPISSTLSGDSLLRTAADAPLLRWWASESGFSF